MDQSNSTYKGVRDKCIDSFQNTLSGIQPIGAPKWLLIIFITPIFLWEMSKLVAQFVWATLLVVLACTASIISAPFVGLYLLIDTASIMTWYFKRIIDKMTGEQ